MDIFQVIQERRSIRQFTDEPVPLSDLEEIIDAARWAPSGGNKQMWKFVVITNKEILDKMSQAVAEKIDQVALEAGNDKFKGTKGLSLFFNQAPVTIAVFMGPYESNGDVALKAADYSPLEIQRLRGLPGVQSIGAAIQNLLLAATAKGYGTCWMCAPVIASYEIEKLLGISEPWELKALIPIGKPARKISSIPRKPLKEIMEIIE